MTWIPAFILALAAGWFLSSAGTKDLFRPAHPVAGAAGAAGLAVLFGPGLASVLFFALTIMGLASPMAILAVLTLFAGGSGALWWATRRSGPVVHVARSGFPWTWVLLLGLVVASILVALGFSVASAANPNGDWDATAIWNLRARFMAGGTAVWRRAISAEVGGFMLGASHPSYPLFLSSFVGMLWALPGGFTTAAPTATSGAIAFAVMALLIGILAARRSLGLGLLAGLLLLSTELFALQSAAQYADLLLALAFLAALVLLDAAAAKPEAAPRRLLIAAGLAIGFAPWIKNEGIPFTVAALVLAAWRFRAYRWFWILLGSAPGLLATVALKAMAQGREGMFPSTVGEAFTKLADPARWLQVFAGFGNAFLQLGPWWAHPVLLVILLTWALRFLPPAERGGRLWLWIPIAVTLASEFGTYLMTTADLTWHLGTSANRLVLQVWPTLIWLVLSTLRTPEEYFPALAVPNSKTKKSRP
jgi:hypothetical protein